MTATLQPAAAAGTGVALALESVVKAFGPVTAVAGVDLTVRRGQFFTLLGPSGSGKTTILKLIAGFEQPTSGRVCLDGRDISALSPAQRGIGVVFQHYALFPHMTVAANIRYPLRLRRWSAEAAAARVREMLALVRLEGLGDRYPRQLSGGQQQRVALARALAFKPSLLLMDEPLGALDRTLRVEMAAEIRRIHREAGTTVVYVTHDREEAFVLSDRIAVMRAGRILQEGDGRRLFDAPVNTFVARFFGDCLVLPVEDVPEARGARARVRVLGQEVEVRQGAPLEGRSPRLVVRPAQIRLGAGPDCVSVSATVQDVMFLGEATLVRCHAPETGEIVARVEPGEADGLARGAAVRVGFRPAHAILVPEA